MLDDLVATERNLKKEPQRRDSLIDGRHANAARRQMQLVAAHILKARRAIVRETQRSR
jgi:hypothetical protein